MSETFTTTELLISARAQGRIPDADPEATDAKLLAIGNRQLSTRFVPLVRKARAEWYQTFENQTVTANVAEYRIPHRATSSSVRAVVLIDTAGREMELQPVPITDRHLYKPQTGEPLVYAIGDDSVVLLPTPSRTGDTLRIVYERRHSTLVDITYSATIATVVSAVSPYSVTLGSVGANLSTPTGSLVDVIDHKSPFSLRVMGATVTGVTTFTSPTGRSVAVGNYFVSAENTVIPPIPAELHPLLALGIAAEWLLPIDPSFSNVLATRLAEGLNETLGLMTQRQQGRKQKMKSHNSQLRRGRVRRGWFADWS